MNEAQEQSSNKKVLEWKPTWHTICLISFHYVRYDIVRHMLGKCVIDSCRKASIVEINTK